MVIIQVREHQVVIVTLFIVYISRFGPAFGLVAKNLVDGGLIVVCIVVCTGKVVPVVFLLGVFVATAGKVKTKPGIDLVRVGDRFCSVVRINFLGAAFLFVIRCRFVIQDWKKTNQYLPLQSESEGEGRRTSVPIDTHANFICFLDQLH